jgi:hypothetical protein
MVKEGTSIGEVGVIAWWANMSGTVMDPRCVEVVRKVMSLKGV